MPKTTLAWNPADYATVAERITAFYAAFPFGRIVTELTDRTERQVTFRAAVYRSADEPQPAATGWASEREGDGDVNAVACLENAETSAIGRALANLGFSASRRGAPAVPGAGATNASARRHDAGRKREAAAPVRLVREAPPPARVAEPASPAAGVELDRGARGDLLQQHANAVSDALHLLDEALRAGYPESRGAHLRERLLQRSVAPSEVTRLERVLREWLSTRVPPVVTDRPEGRPPAPL